MAEEHYFFVSPELITNDQFQLPQDEAYHASKVLRRSAHDIIWLIDGVGSAYKGEITEIDGKKVIGRILERIAGYGESDKKVNLGIGILKKDKLEWVVEKATELGVVNISFLKMDHCIKKDVNIDRLSKIVRSAVKQCGRSTEPLLKGPVSLLDWIHSSMENDGMNLICHPGGEKITDLMRGNKNFINVLVGPEGGFSANELYLTEHEGFLGLDLGNRRLRSETAAISVVSQIQAF